MSAGARSPRRSSTRGPARETPQIWREERQALTDLLTAEEWEAARATTLNAHYTSEAVINGIWSAIQHLGFQGGRVIEPALGAGHFIGLTPEPLRESIAWTGVEIDPLSGAIAKALYPGADIRIAPFESVTWPDGFFDLAISNVPFGAYTVRDKRYSAMAIHDYFFVRSLDKVRAGGIVAFITSRYTLDKESPLVRKEIARRAEFLGAIRLPGGSKGAFAGNAGTDVTTDIIFLKRRAEPQAPDQQPWLSLAQIDTPDGPVTHQSLFRRKPADDARRDAADRLDVCAGPSRCSSATSKASMTRLLPPRSRICRLALSDCARESPRRHCPGSMPISRCRTKTDRQ